MSKEIENPNDVVKGQWYREVFCEVFGGGDSVEYLLALGDDKFFTWDLNDNPRIIQATRDLDGTKFNWQRMIISEELDLNIVPEEERNLVDRIWRAYNRYNEYYNMESECITNGTYKALYPYLNMISGLIDDIAEGLHEEIEFKTDGLVLFLCYNCPNQEDCVYNLSCEE